MNLTKIGLISQNKNKILTSITYVMWQSNIAHIIQSRTSPLYSTSPLNKWCGLNSQSFFLVSSVYYTTVMNGSLPQDWSLQHFNFFGTPVLMVGPIFV